MVMRKGLGKNRGMGYKNIIPRYDSNRHSLNAQGHKMPQMMPNLSARAISDNIRFKMLYDNGYSLAQISKKMGISPTYSNYLFWEMREKGGGKWNKLKNVTDRLGKYPEIPYGYRIKHSNRKYKWTQKVSRGGLSKDVWESQELQGYINQGHGLIAGYIGDSTRNKWKDRILEEELRKQGLSDEGIGMWLTSTSGRHLTDETIKDEGEWRSHVKKNVATAKDDILRWSKDVLVEEPEQKGGKWDNKNTFSENIYQNDKTGDSIEIFNYKPNGYKVIYHKFGTELNNPLYAKSLGTTQNRKQAERVAKKYMREVYGDTRRGGKSRKVNPKSPLDWYQDKQGHIEGKKYRVVLLQDIGGFIEKSENYFRTKKSADKFVRDVGLQKQNQKYTSRFM